MIVGFIGSGNMAAGMARGWAAARASEEAAPEAMLFTDSGSGRATRLAAEVGGEAVGSNAEIMDCSDIVVLAMKPAGLSGVAAELAGPGTVVSILGATPVAKLAEALPGSVIFRLMPNLGVEVRRGTLCLSHREDVPAGLIAPVVALLKALGKVIRLPDAEMDTATAMMSCSPAYFALVADAIAEAGEADGLDRAVAMAMVAESMAGAAELLRGRTAGEIQTAVASPGGSTEAGLDALEEHRAKMAFKAAVDASLARMRGIS